MSGRGSGYKLDFARKALTDANMESVRREAHLQEKELAYQEVDFSQNELTHVGLRIVVDICVRCPKLRVLKLYRNRLDDEAAKGLADLCKKCTNIEEIHLSHNNFTAEGAEVLITAAEEARPEAMAPLWLRLEQNEVGEPDALFEELAARLSVCKRVSETSCTVRVCCRKKKVHLPLFGFQRERRGYRGGYPPGAARALALPPSVGKAGPGRGPESSPTSGAPSVRVAPSARTPKSAAPSVSAGAPGGRSARGAGAAAKAGASPPTLSRPQPPGANPWGLPAKAGPPTAAPAAAAEPPAAPAKDAASAPAAAPAKAPAPSGPPKASGAAPAAAPSAPQKAPAAKAAQQSAEASQHPTLLASGPGGGPRAPGPHPQPSGGSAAGGPARGQDAALAQRKVPSVAGEHSSLSAKAGRRCSYVMDHRGQRRIHPAQLEAEDPNVNQFVCPLCHYWILRPWVSTCSHLFCEDCFKGYVTEQVERAKRVAGEGAVPAISCPDPHCDRQLQKREVQPLTKAAEAAGGGSARLIQRLGNNVPIRCVHHIDNYAHAFGKDAERVWEETALSCSWKGGFGDYESHIQCCPVEQYLSSTPPTNGWQAPPQAQQQKEHAAALAPRGGRSAPGGTAAAPAQKATPDAKPRAEGEPVAAQAEAESAAATPNSAAAPSAPSDDIRTVRHDYHPPGEDRGQIALKAGDCMKIFEVTDTGWAAGVRLDRETMQEVGEPGWFPYGYLKSANHKSKK